MILQDISKVWGRLGLLGGATDGFDAKPHFIWMIHLALEKSCREGGLMRRFTFKLDFSGVLAIIGTGMAAVALYQTRNANSSDVAVQVLPFSARVFCDDHRTHFTIAAIPLRLINNGGRAATLTGFSAGSAPLMVARGIRDEVAIPQSRLFLSRQLIEGADGIFSLGTIDAKVIMENSAPVFLDREYAHLGPTAMVNIAPGQSVIMVVVFETTPNAPDGRILLAYEANVDVMFGNNRVVPLKVSFAAPMVRGMVCGFDAH